jgi:hypothetical protein
VLLQRVQSIFEVLNLAREHLLSEEALQVEGSSLTCCPRRLYGPVVFFDKRIRCRSLCTRNRMVGRRHTACGVTKYAEHTMASNLPLTFFHDRNCRRVERAFV